MAQGNGRPLTDKPGCIKLLEEWTIGDVPPVGAGNASLGKMCRKLGEAGVRAPGGFAVTADAYRDTVAAADAWAKPCELLDNPDKSNVEVPAKRAAAFPTANRTSR